MPKRQVFYSFHYDNDVMRVQQIRQIGALDGNEPVSVNEWEQIRKTHSGIKHWIDINMAYRSCVVVLVGEETAFRPWVKYEIEKAWNDGKGLLGIYIHNLNCPRNGKSKMGQNPFDSFTFNDGRILSSFVRCYNPNSSDAYNDIKVNIDWLIEEAIAARS